MLSLVIFLVTTGLPIRFHEERCGQLGYSTCQGGQPQSKLIRLLILSNLTRLIPLMIKSSSILRKGGFFLRYSRMRWAVAGPIPGRACNSSAVARLTLTLLLTWSPAFDPAFEREVLDIDRGWSNGEESGAKQSSNARCQMPDTSSQRPGSSVQHPIALSGPL